MVQYFKYESPIISYSKGNDKKTKREFFLKDSFLMFELVDSTSIESINNSIAYFESDYRNNNNPPVYRRIVYIKWDCLF